MRRLLGALAAALPGALVFAAVAAADSGLTPVKPASPNAQGITDTYWLILGLTGAVFVIVETALVVFLVRFRSRGRGRTVEGAQIHGGTRLELTWTVVPVLILATIAAFVFVKLPEIENVPPARAGDTLNIRVEGRQYYWQFTYPDGQVSVDQMVVPVGRVVTLDVVSPDVIHSWWVPALGGKIDAIPGRVNHTWFRTKRTGTYTARCAELCGLEHTHMTATVEVVAAADYEQFLAAHEGASPALGEEVFTGGCAKCHGLAGQGDYGPALAGSALVDDPKALELLLRNGKGRMPPVGAGWSSDQMRAATDYLGKRFGKGDS